jgi:NADH-quinone oxidoreductase subunit L
MFRLLYLTFFGEYRGTAHPHESRPVMTVPLVILAVLSTVGGFLVVPNAWDLIANYLRPTLSAYPGGVAAASVTAANWGAMALSVLLALAGIYVANALYRTRTLEPARLRSAFPAFYRAAAHKFYFDEIYETIIVRPVRGLGQVLGDAVDGRGLTPAVDAIGRGAYAFGSWLDGLEPGYLRRYSLTLLTGTLLVVIALALR